MSLLHKIPPMISALAFGYGVGMAAPQSTISSVHAAMGRRHEPPRVVSAVAGLPPVAQVVRVTANEIGGGESRELSRLREVAAREQPVAREGQSCDLERPTYSRRPSLESRSERLVDPVDDLDSAGTEALSRLQLPDLRVPVTRRTLKYVRFFTRTDRGRGMFETWLKRSGRYQEMIQTELRDRRLPEDLMWVAMIESGFDARAKSPAGAVGLWQFMAATGEVYGLVHNRFLDLRKNPRQATKAAAHHLRDLYSRFGAWDLALAAYNMGYEQLLDAIDKYGTADFNELARQEGIPSETSAYVPKIVAAAIVANNLEHFGFEKVDVARPVDAAEIAVPPGTPLKILAKASGVATSAIKTLNPDILGERVPPGRGDYIVMVPADTVSRARAALPAMLENEPRAPEDADALGAVDLLGGREGRELLRRRAHNEDESLLSLLPHPKRHSLRHPFEDEGASRDDDHDSPAIDTDVDGPRLLARRSRRRKDTVLYRVSRGDTVAGVARQFGLEAGEVSRQTKLDEDEKLTVGSLLKLKVRHDLVDELGGEPPRKDKEGKDAEPAPKGKKHKKSRHDST